MVSCSYYLVEMNGEWALELLRWLSSFLLSLIFAFIGYRLGLRSQNIHVLREYVTEIAKKEYQLLFSEIKRNSGLLKNFLEKPNVNFSFPVLDQIYSRGLEEFMKRHHKDLFLLGSFSRKDSSKIHGIGHSRCYGENI